MSFAALLEQAEADGTPPAELARACGMGAGCGMCAPYVKRACATGQTVYHELLDDNDAEVQAERATPHG